MIQEGDSQGRRVTLVEGDPEGRVLFQVLEERSIRHVSSVFTFPLTIAHAIFWKKVGRVDFAALHRRTRPNLTESVSQVVLIK